MKVYLDIEFKNWILDGVFREASLFTNKCVIIKYVSTSRRRHPLTYLFAKYIRKLKVDDDDIVVNQRTLNYMINRNFISVDRLSKVRCLYTHDSVENLLHTSLIIHLKNLKEVLVLNKTDKSMLIKLGVDERRIKVIYGAVDRELFFPSSKVTPEEFVLITGDCKGRKNPSKVFKVIAQNLDLNFVICGRFWESYAKKLKIENQNVRFYDFSMKANASLMRAASTYMTLSLQEGGPFPVLEALASGTPVLSTPVGWVPEILDCENGRLVKQSDSVSEISHKLQECLNLKQKVYSRDLLKGEFSWETLAMKIFELQSTEHGK